ncbi:hypothetical protein DRQ32_09275 [bacterium]|nr:MAG: hypothetical protein DRQ32_09275 [bacterium]
MWTRAILLLIVLSTAGCSYFQKSARLDLAPFAERTVSLAADIEYAVVQAGSAHHLREYKTDPQVLAHGKKWDKIRRLLRGVVAYSIEISTLGASQLAESERIEHFATFLDRLLREPLQSSPAAVRFTIEVLDAMLLDIRQQPDFLAALKSAQPFIDELARISDLLFDNTQDDLTAIVAHLQARIGEDNAGPVATWKALGGAQNRVFASLSLTRQIRFTPTDALIDSLYANEPEYVELPADPQHPTSAELTEMANDLVRKLQIGIDLKELLKPDLERFANQQKELDELYAGAQLQLKKARVTIMIWARAHRNLAEGITDPAKIDIFDVTKKAVNTVL